MEHGSRFKSKGPRDAAISSLRAYQISSPVTLLSGKKMVQPGGAV